jgi:hypothetical protein
MAGNTSAAAGSGAIYGLGIFGAWVYYWQEADGFWEHAYAIFERLLARLHGVRGFRGVGGMTGQPRGSRQGSAAPSARQQ